MELEARDEYTGSRNRNEPDWDFPPQAMTRKSTERIMPFYDGPDAQPNWGIRILKLLGELLEHTEEFSTECYRLSRMGMT